MQLKACVCCLSIGIVDYSRSRALLLFVYDFVCLLCLAALEYGILGMEFGHGMLFVDWLIIVMILDLELIFSELWKT